MKTRRSKGGDETGDTSMEDASGVLQIELPENLDLTLLNELLPEISLNNPSSENVVALYERIVEQGREYAKLQSQLEDLQAETLRKDLEIDQNLQEHEMRRKDLEESLSSKALDAEKASEENNRLVAANRALESERTSWGTSRQASTTELETLKISFSECEREKRDLIDVLTRLRTDDEQREEEVKTLRETLRQVRKDFQDVQSRHSESLATEATTKFKTQHLEQQLELAQSSLQTANSELTRNNEEFAKYRRTKHAELINAMASLDTLSANHAATQATCDALQNSYKEQSRELSQAMQKINEVESLLADRTASYQSEISNQTRLIDLLQSRNEQARIRVEDVEREWEQMIKSASEREQQLSGEIERQRARACRLESIVDELQQGNANDRGNSVSDGEHPIDGARTATPSREPSVFALSPAAGVAARLQKTGKSFTEVYTDYVKLQEELTASQSEERRVKELLSQVLAEIEERTPLLAQQRQDFERTKQEIDQLTGELAQALSNRDSFKTRVTGLETQLQSESLLVTELEQSATDLGRQVQHLTRRIAVMENPSLDNLQILPSANPEVLSADLALSSDQVVLFQNLASLQSQNQMLLRVVHASASALDQKEREFREATEKEESEAIKEANDALAVLEEQLESERRSHNLRLQAYAKELQMHKSLPHQPRTHTQANGFAQEGQDIRMDPSDLRSQFDAYRTESDVDTHRLRDEISRIQQQANITAAELAKANGMVQFLHDRHRIQNDSQQVKEQEMERTRQRSQDLRDQCSTLEIRYHQASESLVQAQATVERLRTENANLKAERAIFKDVENRLTMQNGSLATERAHLANLVGNIQKLHDDLNNANEHDRRRQEGQLQAFEAQTQDLRMQLSHDREASRSASLHKEIETKDLRDKLEQAIANQGSAAQALAVAETKCKHLQERYEDVSRQVEAQKEKVSVYERNHSTSASGPAGEQNLEAELAQLKADLKTAQLEQAQANQHVEQYKGISESNEQAFQQLSATFDELQASSRTQLTDKESEMQALIETMTKLQSELASTRERASEQQKAIDSERMVYRDEQRALETRIVEMTTTAANSHNDNATKENELEALETRAKTSERKYEDAIKAHADAITAADRWKAELTAARASAREALTEAETAKARLTMSEISWGNQKAILDKEAADINKRCQELTEQNELLHHQLEALSAQAARIRHVSLNADVSNTETSDAQTIDNQVADLHSVVTFLRKEKEISELQLEMSKNENARSKTENAHLTRVLEETRTLLSEQRERAAQSATSAAEHAELIERINQLNVLRESNTTLRAECDSQKQLAKQLEGKLVASTSELEPLQRQLRLLQAEVESKTAQMAQLQKEAEHWQERNRQILSKYERSDPAELQSLKAQLEEAQKKAAEAETQHQAEQKRASDEAEQTEKYKKNLQAHREALIKQRNQFTAFKTETEQAKQQFVTELETLKAERDALQTKLNGDVQQELTQLRSTIQTLTDECALLKTQLAGEKAKPESVATDDTAKLLAAVSSERDVLAAAKENLESQLALLRSELPQGPFSLEEKVSLTKAKEEAEKIAAELKEKHASSEEQTKNFRGRLQKVAQELAASKEKIRLLESDTAGNLTLRQSLEDQIKQHQQNLDKAVEEAKEAAGTTGQIIVPSVDPTGELGALEERLRATHAQEIELLKSTLAGQVDSNDSEPLKLQLEQVKGELSSLQSNVDALKKEKDEAMALGMEQGRREAAMKIKLKDNQISKISKRLQEVEQTLLTSANGAVQATATTASAAVPASSPIAPKPPAVATTTAAPSVPTTSVATGTATRGRGVALRGAAVRGRGAPRGAGPPSAPSAGGTSNTSGTTILGAAAKRSRESETEAPDSLAKRLKPAGAPVTLNRTRNLQPDANSSGS